MAAFVCTRCNVTVQDPPPSKTKPLCPSCGWGMLPKLAPLTSEIDFPAEQKNESILNMPMPEELKEVQEKKLSEHLDRLKFAENLDKNKKKKPGSP